MAISYVQSILNTNTGGSSVAATFASSTTSGNLIIVAISSFSTAPVAGNVTDNKGNTYTLVGTVPHANVSNDYLALYYAKNITGGSSHTITLAIGDTSIVILEYSGADTTAPLDVSNTTATGNGTLTPTSNSITPTNNGSLIFSLGLDDSGNNSAITAGTGYTARDQEIDSTSHERLYTEEKVQTTATSVSASFTILNTGSTYAISIAAFKPSANTITTKTQSATARITAQTTKTITAISRITATTIKTQLSISRIGLITLKIITAISRLTTSALKTITSTGRLTIKTIKTIVGLTRITAISVKVQLSTARLTASTLKTIISFSRITKSTIKTILGVTNIRAITQRTISAITRVTGLAVHAQIGITRVSRSNLKTIASIANIITVIVRTKTQSAKSRISVRNLQTQLGTSHIKTAPGLYRIRGQEYVFGGKLYNNHSHDLYN